MVKAVGEELEGWRTFQSNIATNYPQVECKRSKLPFIAHSDLLLFFYIHVAAVKSETLVWHM